MKNHLALLFAVLCCAFAGCGSGSDTSSTRPTSSGSGRDGSAGQPLRVMLIPADGGTEDGTKADFEPIFNAITKQTGLQFEIRVGQSYQAVVEGMVNEKVEIAWLGAVSYAMARARGAAQLLAVGVRDGESTYYSGIFTQKSSKLKSLQDLKGRSIAFGDINSTSSFNFPIAMILEQKIDVIGDLGKILLLGSHANALAALAAKKVDAACASFTSFEKAVATGNVDADQIAALAKSPPIPYPPLAMHVKLEDELKQQLKAAFNSVHKADGVTPGMIRGYGGKRLDRYDANYSEKEFDAIMEKLAGVTLELKRDILKKAATR